ncbi:DUF6763 family protein, partial [Endothiovibrio diazotrophicus]
YKNPRGEKFEVVAFDAPTGNVEIQYYDGTVEELDMDAWGDLEIEVSEPPEDWKGSLDIEREDYGVDLEENRHDEWHNYLEDVDRME